MTQLAEKIVPIKGIRKIIADKMQHSLQNSAQLTHFAECSVDQLFKVKVSLATAGDKVSVQDLLNYATISTLQHHLLLNGRVTQEQVVLASSVDLSVAIALPGNLLIAPAIFGAQDLSLNELKQARVDLTERAKTNKLSVKEMTGGTVTVSNLGLSRVRFFTPILNASQIAIIGFGSMSDSLYLDESGEVASKKIMGLSLTFDHRALDGAPAAEFLTGLCEKIENLNV